MATDPDRAGRAGSDPVPGEGDALTEYILAQSEQGIAVPVLLFGPSGPDGEVTDHPAVVHELFGRLQLDADELDLYSAEAYLVQCGLGQDQLDARLGTSS